MKKITNTKQAEEEIKTALQYAKSIIDTLREPFLVMNRNLRIVSANRSFYTVFKVTKKETIGQLLPNLGNRQWNIPALIRLLKEILPKKRVVEDYEVQHTFKKIGHRIMNLNARQLRISRKMVITMTKKEVRKRKEEEEEEEELILLAIADITKQKETQTKLIHAEKLASLGKLAAMLTHELRNSLSAVRNSVYALKILGLKDEKIKKSFRILDEESEKMDKTINSTLGSILGFVERKKLDNVKRNINKIIKESIISIAIPKNIKINMKLGRLPVLLVNEIYIIQLFSNIIKNAVEAMPKGGRLNITTKKKNNDILVSIQDTGSGIKQEELSKIFEPFYSTRTNNSGAGLGLTICQHIIELYKGSIDIESEVGKGSTFIIKMPIKI